MDLTTILPHRPPMLLVEDVTDVVPGVRLTGRFDVRHNRPWCAGGLPTYLVLESWLQSAAVLVGWNLPAPAGRLALLVGMRDVRLGRAAQRGETVEHHVEIVRSVGNTAICTGVGVVGDEPILRVGQVTVTFAGGDE
jgi:3-hydroxyacyl-[acyl-carrier-protein] dehydratase